MARRDGNPTEQDAGRTTRGGGARVFPRDGHSLRRPPVLFRIPTVRTGASSLSVSGGAAPTLGDTAQGCEDSAADRFVSEVSGQGSAVSAGLGDADSPADMGSPHHQDKPTQGPAAPHFSVGRAGAAVSADALPTTEGPVTHRLDSDVADGIAPSPESSLPREFPKEETLGMRAGGEPVTRAPAEDRTAEPVPESLEPAAPVVPDATRVAKSKADESRTTSVEIPPIVPAPSGRSWMEAYGSKLIPLLLIAAVVTYALLLNGNGTPEPEMILADLELNEGTESTEAIGASNPASNPTGRASTDAAIQAGVTGVPGNVANSMTSAADAGTAGDVTSVTPDFDLSTLMQENTAAAGDVAASSGTRAGNQPPGEGTSQELGTLEAPMMQLDPPRAAGRAGETNGSSAAIPQERPAVQYPLVSRTGQPIREPAAQGGTGAESTALTTSGGWQVDQELAAAAAAAGLPQAGSRSSDPPSAQTDAAMSGSGAAMPGMGSETMNFGGHTAPIRDNQWAQPNTPGASANGAVGQHAEDAIHAAVEAAVSGSFVAPEGSLPSGQGTAAGVATGGEGYWTTGQPASIPDWRRYLPGATASGAGAGVPNGGSSGAGVIQFFPQQGATGGPQPLGAPTGQPLPAGVMPGGAAGPQLQPPQVPAGVVVPPQGGATVGNQGMPTTNYGVPTTNYGVPTANAGAGTAGAGTWPPQTGAGATSNR